MALRRILRLRMSIPGSTAMALSGLGGVSKVTGVEFCYPCSDDPSKAFRSLLYHSSGEDRVQMNFHDPGALLLTFRN
jgi:hypothetical protein